MRTIIFLRKGLDDLPVGAENFFSTNPQENITPVAKWRLSMMCSNFGSNIAVTFNSGSVQDHITFIELEVQASKVMETLCEGRETVAIYSKQSTSLVSCILGVLKSSHPLI